MPSQAAEVTPTPKGVTPFPGRTFQTVSLFSMEAGDAGRAEGVQSHPLALPPSLGHEWGTQGWYRASAHLSPQGKTGQLVILSSPSPRGGLRVTELVFPESGPGAVTGLAVWTHWLTRSPEPGMGIPERAGSPVVPAAPCRTPHTRPMVPAAPCRTPLHLPRGPGCPLQNTPRPPKRSWRACGSWDPRVGLTRACQSEGPADSGA